jgi:putative hemolysin
MSPDIVSEIIVILVLIIFNGLLAMAEMAIVSSRKPRLMQRAAEGSSGAKVALELAKAPTGFLASIQTGITLIGVLTGAFGGATIAKKLSAALAYIPGLADYADAIGIGIVVVLVTFLSLVLGELVPKQLALSAPERVAGMVARPLKHLSAFLSPAVTVLTFATNWTLRILAVKPSMEPPVTEDEVRILIEQGAQAGVFHKDEGRILKRVLRLDDLTATDIMTPRTTIDAIDLSLPRAEIAAKVLASTHQVFPVYDQSPDNFSGTMTARAALDPAFLTGANLAEVVSEPLYVSESMPALKLLARLKSSNKQVAIVVDEYGSSSGIVTVMDVMEAIVGDVPDESSEAPSVVRRRDGSMIVDGMLNVHEFNETLGLRSGNQIPDTDFQTVGGFVMTSLGRIPKEGDIVQWHSWNIEVVDMDARRVDKVLVYGGPKRRKKPKAEPAKPLKPEPGNVRN